MEKKIKHEYLLFLGCSIPARGLNYELSTRKIAEKLGIEFEEFDTTKFTCCGFPLKQISTPLAHSMAAFNLAIAERRGLNICVLCPGCSSHLNETSLLLKERGEEAKIVENALSKLNLSYSGEVKVKHFARILRNEVGLKAIRNAISSPLKNLKVAVHYGCHYMRPSSIYGKEDDPIYPSSLDELVEVTGVENLDYEGKTQCCGGGLLAHREEVAYNMSEKKMRNIKKVGADAIVTACTFCTIMFDINQRNIERKLEEKFGLPVLYYTQLLGLAMGISPQELGLHLNRVSTKNLLSKLGVEK